MLELLTEMINEKFAYAVCKDDISIIENYDKAIADNKMWVCHHKAGILPCGRFSRKDLKKFNLYWHRPANELIFLTKSEHISIHFKGCKLKQKTRSRISEALKNQVQTEETKAKRSKSLTGHPNWSKEHHTEETKKKISIGVKKHPPKTKWGKGHIPWNTGTHGLIKAWNRRRVLQYTKDMVFVAEFESITEAAEKTGVSNIAKAARGKLKTAGGYVWKYK